MASWWALDPEEGSKSQAKTLQGDSPVTSLDPDEDILAEEDEEPWGSAPSQAYKVSTGGFYRRLQAPPRIHILGTGGVGKFIAHSLRTIPEPPPVTLIFHTRTKYNKWEQGQKQIELMTEGVTDAQGDFDAELSKPVTRHHGKEVGENSALDGLSGREIYEEGSELDQSYSQTGMEYVADTGSSPSDEPIYSLIITVKAPSVVSALSSVKHRLHRYSTILFLQNGMGIVDDVNEHVFTDPGTRPHYMIGVNSHGLTNTGDASAIHAGFGTISLGLLPHSQRLKSSAPDLKSNPSKGWFDHVSTSRYLLRTLCRTPVLCATAFPPAELLLLQLEKLAVNAIVNPLTVMLDARNGSILYNYHLTRVMRLLLSEISLIFRSLPELKNVPNVASRFDPGRLETIVVGVAEKTKHNISSMLQDVRGGKRTEIDYITGYIIKRGEALGLRPAMNYLIMQLVKGKQQMIGWERSEELPFEGGVSTVLPYASPIPQRKKDSGVSSEKRSGERL